MALFNVELNIGGKWLFLLGAAQGKINLISWDFFPVQAKLKEATPSWRLIDVGFWRLVELDCNKWAFSSFQDLLVVVTPPIGELIWRDLKATRPPKKDLPFLRQG